METRRQRRVIRRRLRKVGATLAVVTALGATGAIGGTAFAGGGSDQCSHFGQTCEENYGGNGFSHHYVDSNGEYHNFNTYQGSGRS